MKAILKVFSILPRADYLPCIGIIIAMMIGAALEAVGIGAILPLISIMGDSEFLSDHPSIAAAAKSFGINTHAELIVFLNTALIAVYLLKNAYIAWEIRMQMRFAINRQIRYSSELMGEYLAKPYLFHVEHNTATLIRNVNNGALLTFSAILIPCFLLITEIVTAATIWVMLVAVDAFSAVIVAGVLGALLYGVLKLCRRKLTEQGIIQNECAGIYIKWLNQGLGAIKETKIMHKEAFFLNAYSKAYEKYGQANYVYQFYTQMPKTIIEAVVVSGLLLLIVFKVLRGENPMDIVGLLGLLALAAFRLMPSANRIIGYLNNIKFQLPLFNELYPEFAHIRERLEKHQPVVLENPPAPLPFDHEIKVENLAFRYPQGKKDVLKNVNFSIAKGKFIGIVGASGAGKTTFVDILLGLLTPTSGKITVDGVDIAEKLAAWQENIAYVPQSIYLIDGTIRENIALGEEPDKIDNNRVMQALEMAELKEFVENMDDGIETMVGERGVKLSGGQRQRIGIARALYQKPTVLVLDEATSALDNDTEKSITDTILKFKGKITIIAIAHRVSTLEECDYKVNFIDGEAEIVTTQKEMI